MAKTTPFTLVIFGATGDLTRRKLIPAVWSLYRQNLLPEEFRVIGFARREWTDDVFRDRMKEAVTEFSDCPLDEEEWRGFARCVHYHCSEFDQIEGYRDLRLKLESFEAEPGDACTNWETCCKTELRHSVLFYLATQPGQFSLVIDKLRQAGFHSAHRSGQGWARIIIEKPFGTDLASALKMNREISKGFSENQIYRIDHYLGKETVQNLLVFRFANSLFEPLWNGHFIDHVQITVSETVGVEGRGGYYDQSGAIRDIVQNHVMQLLALVAMEPPVSLKGDDIRDAKVQAIRSLRPIPEDCLNQQIVRAQYTRGVLPDGREAKGYLEEEGIDPKSITETYAALKVQIDNWRWAGVPFYIRTGKYLPVRITEIGIHFKPVPNVLFNSAGQMQPNMLALRIQPNEGIALQFQVKEPGPAMKIEPYKMRFAYAESFDSRSPEAYERLILDAALGDTTLFIRNDEVEAAWRFLDPVLRGCLGQNRDTLAGYPAGSWGPLAADELLERDGHQWELVRMPARK